MKMYEKYVKLSYEKARVFFEKNKIAFETEEQRRVSELDNVSLVRRTIEAGAGDDYDGCFTQLGQLEFDLLRKELETRLLKSGFIQEKIYKDE